MALNRPHAFVICRVGWEGPRNWSRSGAADAGNLSCRWGLPFRGRVLPSSSLPEGRERPSRLWRCSPPSAWNARGGGVLRASVHRVWARRRCSLSTTLEASSFRPTALGVDRRHHAGTTWRRRCAAGSRSDPRFEVSSRSCAHLRVGLEPLPRTRRPRRAFLALILASSNGRSGTANVSRRGPDPSSSSLRGRPAPDVRHDRGLGGPNSAYASIKFFSFCCFTLVGSRLALSWLGFRAPRLPGGHVPDPVANGQGGRTSFCITQNADLVPALPRFRDQVCWCPGHVRCSIRGCPISYRFSWVCG